MKQATQLALREDDVDMLVDTLLAEPDRADDIKNMLRRRLGVEGRAQPRSPLSLVSTKTDEIDEMWDNVPV